MSNLLELLQSQLDEGMVDQLSARIGASDRQKTAVAAQGIMTTLVSALARNASDPQKAPGLYKALEQDHDGSLINNLSGLLNGNITPQQTRAANGSGILRHLLGNNQGPAVEMISKMSGLDSNKTGNLMTMLAPIVMGMLGKQKSSQGLDLEGLSGMLNGTVNQQRKSGNPLMDLATRFLDKDGDGSVIDDVAGMVGKSLFGKIFGGGR